MNKLVDSGRVFAKKQIVIAVLVTFVCSAIAYSFGGYASFKSALLAGLVAIIPNIIFMLKAFQYAGASASDKVVKSFYQGEKLKIVVTAVLFSVVLALVSIEPITFFTSFSIVMVTPLLSGFLFKL